MASQGKKRKASQLSLEFAFSNAAKRRAVQQVTEVGVKVPSTLLLCLYLHVYLSFAALKLLCIPVCINVIIVMS